MLDNKFFKDDFQIKDFNDIKPAFDELLSRKISSKDDLKELIYDMGKLFELIEEDYAKIYINMTRFTDNEKYTNAYKSFNENILPHYQELNHKLQEKIINNKYKNELDNDDTFKIILKHMELEVAIFSKENIPIKTKLNNISTEYSQIMGSMQVEFRGEKYTPKQMMKFLKDKNRQTRMQAFEALAKERIDKKDKLNDIFNRMLVLRQQLAKNAGFENYRDYRFAELKRIDYNVDDCKKFHESIKNACMPYYKQAMNIKKDKLKIDELYPYDKIATADNEKTLKPFETVDEFVEKSVLVFSNVHEEFGKILKAIYDKGNMDLENRKGKAPGGYNYPLLKTGMPFIFMNAVKLHSDMRTLMHEGGHGVHTVATKSLFPYFHKSTSSEIAELASMSMELLTMEYWNIFYPDEDDLKQAKREQLYEILTILPWIAVVDKFQHWIYENPTHSVSEREDMFKEIALTYSEAPFNWNNYQDYLKVYWQKQLHIYEVPFYYIEYGMAQLGALQIWKQYKEIGKKAVDNYYNALKLGSSKPISEVYKTAGIKFDFSEKIIEELISFVFDEYKKLL